MSDSKSLEDVLEFKFSFKQIKICHEVHPFVKPDNEQTLLALLKLSKFPPGPYFLHVLCSESGGKVKGSGPSVIRGDKITIFG